MINPHQVLPEEPTAVTPHGGFCGGKSQQWLRYPTDLHVRFDERGVETGTTGELVRHRQTKGAATDMVDLKPPAPHSDSTVCHERAVCVQRCGTVREMKEGPSRSAVRCRSQATASCCRQERWW